MFEPAKTEVQASEVKHLKEDPFKLPAYAFAHAFAHTTSVARVARMAHQGGDKRSQTKPRPIPRTSLPLPMPHPPEAH